ncbi:hypothetical protein NKH49_33930 [Mesorhizobium sp. M1088]|uniref:hypothetical protein n=1 Tax=Mesorhizobium sp. M1088 TaxID=2957056 RepID=UPI0033383EDD
MMVDLLNIELPKARQRVNKRSLSSVRPKSWTKTAASALTSRCATGLGLHNVDWPRPDLHGLRSDTLNIRPLGGASQQAANFRAMRAQGHWCSRASMRPQTDGWSVKDELGAEMSDCPPVATGSNKVVPEVVAHASSK